MSPAEARSAVRSIAVEIAAAMQEYLQLKMSEWVVEFQGKFLAASLELQEDPSATPELSEVIKNTKAYFHAPVIQTGHQVQAAKVLSLVATLESYLQAITSESVIIEEGKEIRVVARAAQYHRLMMNFRAMIRPGSNATSVIAQIAGKTFVFSTVKNESANPEPEAARLVLTDVKRRIFLVLDGIRDELNPEYTSFLTDLHACYVQVNGAVNAHAAMENEGAQASLRTAYRRNLSNAIAYFRGAVAKAPEDETFTQRFTAELGSIGYSFNMIEILFLPDE